ncbi:MAG: hypothetical protein EA001_04455 [Oscillatoriales cyanobacterium]|nr:MAG: hypothetical protein EA001_04455 [Oscillatoriales cyanobacterium]
MTGPGGSGKTTWILQELQAQQPSPQPAAYCALGSGTCAIDATWLQSHVPIELVDENMGDRLLALVLEGVPVYLELGFYLDVGLMPPLLNELDCRRVVVAALAQAAPWQNWATEWVSGRASRVDCANADLWRGNLPGQVLDASSLDTAWLEIVSGAYGRVDRAKGLLPIAEGQTLLLNYMASDPPSVEGMVTELPLPLLTEGRPTGYVGLELVGEALDRPALVQLLRDCCLSDAELASAQSQLRSQLATS